MFIGTLFIIAKSLSTFHIMVMPATSNEFGSVPFSALFEIV